MGSLAPDAIAISASCWSVKPSASTAGWRFSSSLLNEKNEVVARLGDDVARVTGKDGGGICGDRTKWEDGKFVHPHDACFGHDGSIFVAEWVGTGRVSKLKKLA